MARPLGVLTLPDQGSAWTFHPTLTNGRAGQYSLRLNADRLNHLAPLLCIFDDEFTEIGR
jgi:hypothetical protein